MGDIKVDEGRIKNQGKMVSSQGCGDWDDKCSCTWQGENWVRMQGAGTSGTWTGLYFCCNGVEFEFNNVLGTEPLVKCNFCTQQPYSGSNGLTVTCDRAYRFNIPAPPYGMPASCWHCKPPALVFKLSERFRQPRLPTYKESKGYWKFVGSGTAYHIEESVTSETTITEENTKSVEAALTQGAEFQVGTETSSATYKVETTRGWASSVSQTMSNMRSKGKTHSCGTQTCSGGVYQWFTDLTSDDEISGPKVTVGTCNFMCQEQDGPDYVPKCPMGSCNRNYWGDQGVGGNKASNSDGYQCPCCLPSVSKALAHLVCPSGEKLDSIALTAWAKAKIQKNEGTARLQKKKITCALIVGVRVQVT